MDEKEKKNKLAEEIEKHTELCKPLQIKKDEAAEREKELGAKVEIKVIIRQVHVYT